MQTQTKAIVRDRFQLTIPDAIRVRTNWLGPGSVVTVSWVSADEIVIKPYMDTGKTDWNKVWRNVKLARSHTGTHKGSLAEFIASDRENH